ncbi:MAG TPA: hypothetical protein VF686_08885 [Brevundimonas sp.]|jgi:hypothetical protein
MFKHLIAVAALALSATPAAAEVVERSADHFVLRYAVALEAVPADFIDALEHIGEWWNPAHTYSGDARNLSLALDAGTCFCEAMPDGSTFDHGGVYEYDPATGVLIDAALGPLRGKTTLSNWSIGWTGANRGTELVMSYVVRGEGLGAMADGVDTVMGEQFQRMVHFVEYGEP